MVMLKPMVRVVKVHMLKLLYLGLEVVMLLQGLLPLVEVHLVVVEQQPLELEVLVVFYRQIYRGGYLVH